MKHMVGRLIALIEGNGNGSHRKAVKSKGNGLNSGNSRFIKNDIVKRSTLKNPEPLSTKEVSPDQVIPMDEADLSDF